MNGVHGISFRDFSDALHPRPHPEPDVNRSQYTESTYLRGKNLQSGKVSSLNNMPVHEIRIKGLTKQALIEVIYAYIKMFP